MADVHVRRPGRRGRGGGADPGSGRNRGARTGSLQLSHPAREARAAGSDPRRIAVLPAFGLGDAVFTIPALRALAARFPGAEISVLGASWLTDLIGPPRGPAHAVVPLPDAARRWLSTGAGWEDDELTAFLEATRADPFDLAVQLFGGGGTSNRLVGALGAERTVGLRAPTSPALDAAVPYAYWQSEVARRLEVVALVGSPAVELDPTIAVLDGDRSAAAPLLAARAHLPLALLVPGAGDGRRRWPPASFAVLANALDDRGMAVAVVGAAADRPLAREIAERAAAPVLDLTGRTSISALIGLAAAATLVIGNDTGPTHVAAAVGAATVPILWAGNLINGGRLFRTRYRPQLSWRLDCPVCGRSTIHDRCPHDASFVADVRVDDVVAAATVLLEGR